jgi:hypothetical protein
MGIERYTLVMLRVKMEADEQIYDLPSLKDRKEFRKSSYLIRKTNLSTTHDESQGLES